MIMSLKQWEIKIKPRIKLNHNIYTLQGKDCLEEKILVVICTIYCENLFFDYNIIFHDHEKGLLSTFNFNFNFITFVFFKLHLQFLGDAGSKANLGGPDYKKMTKRKNDFNC